MEANEKQIRRIDEKGVINLANMPKSELEKYEKIASSLKITDKNSIANYGQAVQNFMSKSSDNFLKQVRMSTIDDELNSLIVNLETQLNVVDKSDFDETSFKNLLRRVPIIKHIIGTVESIKKKYDNVLANVDGISNKISQSRLALMRDNQLLEVMLQEDINAVKMIEELIIAASVKLEEVNEQLNQMLSNRENYDEFEIQDLMSFKENLENKIQNMKLVRYTFKQTLYEIRIVQNANIKTVEKAQEVITTTITIWKNQIATAIAAKNCRSGAENNRLIREATNRLIIENAKNVKEAAMLVEEESRKGVVSMDALEESTKTIIETFNEIKSIRERVRQESIDCDTKFKAFEDALKSASSSNEKLIASNAEYATPMLEASVVQ